MNYFKNEAITRNLCTEVNNQNNEFRRTVQVTKEKSNIVPNSEIKTVYEHIKNGDYFKMNSYRSRCLPFKRQNWISFKNSNNFNQIAFVST